jgi:hypothetical protein
MVKSPKGASGSVVPGVADQYERQSRTRAARLQA